MSFLLLALPLVVSAATAVWLGHQVLPYLALAVLRGGTVESQVGGGSRFTLTLPRGSALSSDGIAAQGGRRPSGDEGHGTHTAG